MTDEHKYDNIINLPHHQSKKRKRMSRLERAAQFGAFRALTGYEDEIAETSRRTDKRAEIDDYAKSEINRKLIYIRDHISDSQEITVTYFVPDERKTGGEYVTKTGTVDKLIEYKRQLVFTDGSEIPIDEIFSIEGVQF